MSPVVLSVSLKYTKTTSGDMRVQVWNVYNIKSLGAKVCQLIMKRVNDQRSRLNMSVNCMATHCRNFDYKELLLLI